MTVFCEINICLIRTSGRITLKNKQSIKCYRGEKYPSPESDIQLPNSVACIFNICAPPFLMNLLRISFRLTHVLHLLHHHTSEWFWCVDNKNNKPHRLFSLIAILVSLDEVNKKMYPKFCRGPLLLKQSLDDLQSTKKVMLNSLSEKQVVRMYTRSSKCLMTSFL